MRNLTPDEIDQINEADEIRDNAIEKTIYIVATIAILIGLCYLFTQS